MFTLDASIFVRRASPNDSLYAVCHALLDAIQIHAVQLYEPVLVLPEVAGAVSRIFRDPMRGRLYADLLRDLPNTTYVPVDASSHRARTALQRQESQGLPASPTLWERRCPEPAEGGQGVRAITWHPHHLSVACGANGLSALNAPACGVEWQRPKVSGS